MAIICILPHFTQLYYTTFRVFNLFLCLAPTISLRYSVYRPNKSNRTNCYNPIFLPPFFTISKIYLRKPPSSSIFS